MFDNVGKELKEKANSYFRIGITLIVIFGLIAIGNVISSRYGFDWKSFFVVILSCIGVASLWRLLTAILFGFGKLIENTDNLAEKTNELIKIQKAANGVNEKMVEQEQEMLVENNDTPEEDWKCPKCGQINKAYIGTCPYCFTQRE